MSHAISHTTVLIEDGNTEATTLIDTLGWLLSGIIVPAEFDGTAITFQACDTDTGTFLDVYDADGNQLSVTTSASRHVLIEPQTFAGARYVKLVAGTAQTGDTSLLVALHRES